MPLELEQYQKVLQSRRHPEDIKKIDMLSEKVERLEAVLKAFAKAAQPELEKKVDALLKIEESTPQSKTELRLPES